MLGRDRDRAGVDDLHAANLRGLCSDDVLLAYDIAEDEFRDERLGGGVRTAREGARNDVRGNRLAVLEGDARPQMEREGGRAVGVDDLAAVLRRRNVGCGGRPDVELW